MEPKTPPTPTRTRATILSLIFSDDDTTNTSHFRLFTNPLASSNSSSSTKHTNNKSTTTTSTAEYTKLDNTEHSSNHSTAFECDDENTVGIALVPVHPSTVHFTHVTPVGHAFLGRSLPLLAVKLVVVLAFTFGLFFVPHSSEVVMAPHLGTSFADRASPNPSTNLKICPHERWRKGDWDHWNSFESWCSLPVEENTRGIVVTFSGSNDDHVIAVRTFLRSVRNISSLPVELFYAGAKETPSRQITQEFLGFGEVTLVNLYDRLASNVSSRHKCLPGFAFHKDRRMLLQLTNFKILSLFVSRFEEAITFDANAVLFQPPETFFNLHGYAETGFLMFRDYAWRWQTPQQKAASLRFGLHDPFQGLGKDSLDSSCLVTHRTRAKAVLCGAAEYALFDATRYPTLFGDKDVWRFVALAINSTTAQLPRGMASNFTTPEGEYTLLRSLHVHNLTAGYLLTDYKHGMDYTAIRGHLQFDDNNVPLYLNSQESMGVCVGSNNLRYYDGRAGTKYPKKKPSNLQRMFSNLHVARLYDHVVQNATARMEEVLLRAGLMETSDCEQ